MNKKYAITILKWALYKYYEGIHEALALHQLIEAEYDLCTRSGNTRAIRDYLHFTSFAVPEVIHTQPDEVSEDHINRNPRKGMVIKAAYPDYIIYVEMKHPRYNRSRSLLDLEARVPREGHTYLVVDGFTDLLSQLTSLSIGGILGIDDTS